IVAALDAETPAGAAIVHSHPLWIVERWWGELGPSEVRALMERDNEPAESAVRANRLKTTAAELVELLDREDVEARTDRLAPGAARGAPVKLRAARRELRRGRSGRCRRASLRRRLRSSARGSALLGPRHAPVAPGRTVAQDRRPGRGASGASAADSRGRRGRVAARW